MEENEESKLKYLHTPYYIKIIYLLNKNAAAAPVIVIKWQSIGKLGSMIE